MGAGSGPRNGSGANVTLRVRPERRLIREDGSFRHIDFQVQVSQETARTEAARTPLTLALVLDRSGSMQGEKMQIARQAALGVLERLDERDQAAVVVFDDRIDIVQAKAAVTPALKASVRAALALIEARANTALHEGWLTGCNALASERLPAANAGLSRCFLLTDGLANVGVTDPEQIASEAAGIREHAGIGTSTFGIGNDYNELLLGPLAVAGGGQFHHLRTADEIANTFIGELGDLLAVSARQVRLEIEVETGVQIDLISAYWANESSSTVTRASIAIGDLLSGEERHIVARFGFPARQGLDARVVRARVLWVAEDGERSSDWQEMRFSYADKDACDAEARDPSVMHWVGLHEASRAQREAIKRNNAGDLVGARAALNAVATSISVYAGKDEELQNSLAELESVEQQMANAPLQPELTKEMLYRQQTSSRGQKDYRSKK
ncbi:MAG TPA: VWA domain-containing protein [Ktedonobacterales bacterium]|nr:VWA domain-containing protein [Ktedonobacterales bacterium]